MLSVYLAASSSEIPRARAAVDALRAAGIRVVSTWIDIVAQVGDANPRDASREDRLGWVTQDLAEVALADVLWFLVGPSRGAWAEMGVAYMLGKTIVCSGDTKQSVFCALGQEFADDEAALVFLTLMHHASNGCSTQGILCRGDRHDFACRAASCDCNDRPHAAFCPARSAS